MQKICVYSLGLAPLALDFDSILLSLYMEGGPWSKPRLNKLFKHVQNLILFNQNYEPLGLLIMNKILKKHTLKILRMCLKRLNVAHVHLYIIINVNFFRTFFFLLCTLSGLYFLLFIFQGKQKKNNFLFRLKHKRMLETY